MIHRLRELIKELGETQERFALTAGIQPSVISEIVNGKKNLGEEHIVAICEAYPILEPYMFFLDVKNKNSIKIMKNYDKSPEYLQKTIEHLLGIENV